MGSWFCNLQIRKKEGVTKDAVLESVAEFMKNRGYLPVEKAEEADATVAIVADTQCPWISVYSDGMMHDDSDSCSAIATPFSARLHTDVVGIACFDSDYLYLNLVNADEEVIGWVGIGKGAELGIKRRNSLTPWKKKVFDYPAFAAAAKETYICADEFLSVAASHLDLPVEQSATSLDYLKDENLNAQATYNYFRVEDEENDTRVPKLKFAYVFFGEPCLAERENKTTALNMGVASKGITIYFTGPYVEKEEITFSDVTVMDLQEEKRQWFDLQPVKEQLPDGQWAYVCRVPEYEIPPAVPKRMTKEKRGRLQWARYIRLYFTPHGNPRKMLDVTVVMVPNENPQGHAVWNIWHPHGSKSEFIKHHNEMWKFARKMESEDKCLPLFKESDFDD